MCTRATKLRVLFLLLGCALSAKTSSTELVPGVYSRQSRVCGGPGTADGAPISCSLVREDELEVVRSPYQHKETAKFLVKAYFSYGYGQGCHFEGQGAADPHKIDLSHNEGVHANRCRLSLSVKNGVIRVNDPGNSCARSMCSDSKGRLDGIHYKRLAK